MPYPHKLARIAELRAEPLELLIPRLLKKHGTPYLVAVELGVYPNSIRYWLHKNGWRVSDGKWIAPGEPKQTGRASHV